MSRIGSRPNRLGIRVFTSSMMRATAVSGSSACTKSKSLSASGGPRSGIEPWLMRWALVMMRLCAACRNTSVRRTTGTAPDEMTSASTWPGPTDGSWSMSPTIRRAALSGTAFMNACISMTSTMEVSSTTSRSQSSGLSSPRLNPPPLGSTSSSRWMVLASKPVASVMRLAARPVGAHSRISVPFAARIRRMALTMVVFPTPGPPVMTSTLDISASLIAAIWLSARARPICFSTHGKALSGSIQGHGSVPFASRVSRSAMVPTRRHRPPQSSCACCRKRESAAREPAISCSPSGIIRASAARTSRRR